MNASLLSFIQLLIYLNFPDIGYPSNSNLEDDGEKIMIGNPAPDFSLADLDGDSLSLSSLRGDFVVIHIATTWCPFCNAEAPYLEELYRQYKDKRVQVLIIDVKEPKDLVQAKLQERFNLSFPVLLDLDGSVAASYAPPGVLPDLARDEVMLASNLLIDPEGKIQFLSLLDSKNFDAKLVDLKKRLDELLAAD
ncbi:MAG: redoxin domain-containing protein [Cyclobacteriaceae bacterium]|nr:redoxin domain-containing protein [Cyclobacteriaceae bacterium]